MNFEKQPKKEQNPVGRAMYIFFRTNSAEANPFEDKEIQRVLRLHSMVEGDARKIMEEERKKVIQEKADSAEELKRYKAREKR